MSRALTFVAVLFLTPSARSEPPFELVIEEGARTTVTGDVVSYRLYVPVVHEGGEAPPWPAVVLTHGFARSGRYHTDNARALAEGGVVVLVPNLTSLFGAGARGRNAANTADHVRWLVERSSRAGDALEGLVDAARFGLAGHSAGAAVSFEAALALASSATPVEALALLDGVPWSRTERSAPRLPPMKLASFTSEPSSCNAFGSVLGLNEDLRFPNEDVRIVGATHCDPESPTDVLCRIVCGGGSSEAQARYRDLMRLFFEDAFGQGESDAYESALAELSRRGAVEITPYGPDVALRLFANGRRGGGLEPGALRVTADVFARPTGREAAWFFGIRSDGATRWVTPGGVRERPAPWARFAPEPIEDLVLLESALRPGAETRFFFFALDATGPLAFDSIGVRALLP